MSFPHVVSTKLAGVARTALRLWQEASLQCWSLDHGHRETVHLDEERPLVAITTYVRELLKEYLAGRIARLTYDFPGPLDVAPGGGVISDSHAQDAAPIQRGVRQEYFARRVDPFEQPAVVVIAP